MHAGASSKVRSRSLTCKVLLADHATGAPSNNNIGCVASPRLSLGGRDRSRTGLGSHTLDEDVGLELHQATSHSWLLGDWTRGPQIGTLGRGLAQKKVKHGGGSQVRREGAKLTGCVAPGRVAGTPGTGRSGPPSKVPLSCRVQGRGRTPPHMHRSMLGLGPIQPSKWSSELRL